MGENKERRVWCRRIVVFIRIHLGTCMAVSMFICIFSFLCKIFTGAGFVPTFVSDVAPGLGVSFIEGFEITCY